MELQYISFFIENNQQQIKKLYQDHRGAFINFGKKYGLSHEDLTDIYQDAFVALRKKALSGNLYDVKSSLRTYLFGIGKHLIFNELKRKNKFAPIIDSPKDSLVLAETIKVNAKEPLTIEQKLLQQNFKKLGKKCQHVLTLFFYRGLSNIEIAEKEGYENEAVVRSQKSRCLKQLKELIRK